MFLSKGEIYAHQKDCHCFRCTGVSYRKGKKFPNLKGPNWKGEKASYRAHHIWVQTRLGKADSCVLDQNHLAARYHWANISHEYKRDLNDWINLCPKCHSAFDRGKISLKYGR